MLSTSSALRSEETSARRRATWYIMATIPLVRRSIAANIEVRGPSVATQYADFIHKSKVGRVRIQSGRDWSPTTHRLMKADATLKRA